MGEKVIDTHDTHTEVFALNNSKPYSVLSSVLGKFTGPSQSESKREEAQKEFEAKFGQLKQKCQLTFSGDPSQAHSDDSLCRFLQAFGTVDSAFHHIVKYNRWRQEFGVDQLSPDDNDILEEMALQKVHLLRTRDVKGRPVVYVIARRHLTNEQFTERVIKFTVYMLELAVKRINEDVINNICLVFDLKGFTMANMDYQFVKNLIWLLSRCYPQRLGICLVLNSPLIFSGCWTVIRPWLNEVTASKVTFVSSETELCTYLNPDGLPPTDE